MIRLNPGERLVLVHIMPIPPGWHAKHPHVCTSVDEPGISVEGLPLKKGLATVVGLVESYVF